MQRQIPLAARAERLPEIAFGGSYGGGGTNPANYDQVYSVQGSLNVLIFTSGRIRSDIHAAEAVLVQQNAEYHDLQGRVEYDLRISRLDVQSSESAVKVAEANQKLAERALEQSEDRYRSGVTNYLEVLEAQEARVTANEKYIASLFSYNVAKIAVARVLGSAETRLSAFFGEQQRLNPWPITAIRRPTMATPARLEEVEKNASPNSDKEVVPRAKVSKKVLAIALAGVTMIGSLGYWLHTRHFESTDDAQVDGHFAQLNTRVTGTVTMSIRSSKMTASFPPALCSLELDPRDYEAELEHARATLETKQAKFHAAELQVPITDASAFSQLHLAEAAKQEAVASVAAAEANLTAAQHRVQQDQAVADRAERDCVRYASLVEKREISRSYYDARATEATACAQTLDSDRAAVAAAEQEIAQARSMVVQREAQVANARTAPQ